MLVAIGPEGWCKVAPVRTNEKVRVLRISDGAFDWRGDAVVVEEPLRIHMRHGDQTSVLGSTMRTPGHDHELAVGLAVAEGIVSSLDDVVEVRPCAGDLRASDTDVLIVLRDSVVVDESLLGRVAHPSSACGMCGRDQIESLLAKVAPSRREVALEPAVLQSLPESLRLRQAVFDKTGGLHAAGLATAVGEMLVVREDVGRHNAVDKVVGRALLDDLRGDVLFVSGRLGFEIVQKAAMAGIPVVASVSAPTSLAVDAAREAGLTLVAFVREGRLTVYAGAERIARDQEAAPW
jgi:FdhD protein